ncbi:WD40/YVTN/BNR-like repeat-containing protein [Caenimonas sedimenti]|nr:hypothetical protein [Caenimonas sedimenti]
MVQQPGRAVLLAAASTGTRLVAVGERGVVALSDDGGKQWRQVPVPTSVSLTAVRFGDGGRGVAVGHGGIVLTSQDSGASWQRRLDGRQAATLAVDAARRSGSAMRIKEAERLVSEGADKPFLDVLLLGEQKILAVGAYGIAFASEDGGRTWTPWMDRLPNEKGQHLYLARKAGDTLLVAGEQGLILRSTDNGATFQPLASPYKGSWFAGELPRSGEFVLAGLRGNAWRSSDGGSRWVQLANPHPASITSTLAAGGALLFANQAGVVLRLQGDALVPVKTAAPLPPLAGLVAAGDGLLGVGLAGVVPVEGRAR